jgi:hypothetical protein
MLEMSLARLRQLSAHEIGHTLGIAHNYIASTQGANGRASVMDYPHPLVQLRADGTIDLSAAYDAAIGEWDKVAVAYGYQDFPEGTNEEAALDSILSAGAQRGLTFLSDNDARPLGSAHPQTHLWDNGGNATQELERVLTVRRAALTRFGENAIRRGTPLATLEEALVPLYLHHRYQTEAAAKAIGGAYYTYALRGDGQQPFRRVPASEQNAALAALLRTLEPATLRLPNSLLDMLPPRPYGFGMHQELFARTTGLVFDAVSPAATAADLTFALLLDPERAARLVQQKSLDPALPGLGEVLTQITGAVMNARTVDAYEAEIARAVQRTYAERLMNLAMNASMPQVRALTTYHLSTLPAAFPQTTTVAQEDHAHRSVLMLDIQRFMARPMEPVPARPMLPPAAPPGQPIGMPDWFLMCDVW